MLGLCAAGLVGCLADGGVDRVGERQEEVRVCPGSDRVDGLDVSYYEGQVDWPAVRQAGKRFAFIRVSDGTGFPDTEFARNWAGAKAAGVLRGPYQFFRPAEDPNAQADLFLQKIDAAGSFEPGDLPPVMDIETTGGQTTSVIAAHMTTWLGRVQQATGRIPIIYTASGLWADMGNPDGFASFPLWVANYGVTCPSMPASFTAWKFWQYTSTGSVAGLSGAIDLDRWNGTLDELLAFANGTSPPNDGGAQVDAGSGSDAGRPDAALSDAGREAGGGQTDGGGGPGSRPGPGVAAEGCRMAAAGAAGTADGRGALAAALLGGLALVLGRARRRYRPSGPTSGPVRPRTTKGAQ